MSKITNLTEATSLDNANDWLVAVDVSDTTQSASGTNKKIKPSNLGVGGSPLTTKGDLYTYGNADARLPVGSDGEVLTADSTESTGVKWSNPNPVPYGIIYENDNFTDASDFTAFGDASAVASGGKLRVTCVTNGTFDQYLVLNTTTTGLGKHKTTIEFELPNAPASNTFGLGVGIRSVNTYVPLSMVARISLTNTGTQGDRYFEYTNTHPGAYTIATSSSVSSFAVSQNDTIQIVLEQDLDEITITYWNKTTSNKNILSYTYTLPNAPFPSNTGQFAIHCIGGTYDVTYYKVESKEWKNAKLLCIGDSKLNGFTGDSFEQSIPQQLEFLYRGIHDNTGGNDRSADVLLKIQEIIDFAPKKVLLNIGSNDKREGRTLLQWQTDYDDIVTQLEAAGIDVYHLLQFNESVLSFTDYNSHITGTYSADRIVDPLEVTLDVSGVHPDQTGMDQAFMAIISKIGDKII